MAPYNVTAEDSTPLISYAPEGKWSDSPWFNQALTSYSGNSTHSTYTQGATATVKFNGTGIWLYGAMRPKYGSYSITVDGNTVANGSAQSEQNSFKQLLGGASGLSNGMHTLELTNTGDGTGLDLDYLTFQAEVGSGGNVSETTYDDGHDALHYAPDDTWKFLPQPASMNGTLHWTTKPGASVSLNINGDAVAVYGTVSPHHADMEVSIDGNTQMVKGGGANGLHPQQLLYFGNGLGGQSHNLTVTNKMQDGSNQFIDLDAIKVWTASGGDSGSNSTAGNGGSGPSSIAGGSGSGGNNFGATTGFGQTNLVLPGDSSGGDASGDSNGSAQPSSTSSGDNSNGDPSSSVPTPTPTPSAFNNSESTTSSTSTSTSTPTSSPSSAADHNQASSSKHNTAIAAGVGVSLVVIVILLSVLLFMCCRRRQARAEAAAAKPPSIRKISDKEMSPDLPLQSGPAGPDRATWEQPAAPAPPPPALVERGSFVSQRLSTGTEGEFHVPGQSLGYSPDKSSPEMYSDSSAETLPLPQREESPERWSRASYGSSTHIVRRSEAAPALDLDMDAATARGAGGNPQLDLDLHKLPALPKPSAQPTMERQWSGASTMSRDEDGNLRPSRPRRPPTLTLSPGA